MRHDTEETESKMIQEAEAVSGGHGAAHHLERTPPDLKRKVSAQVAVPAQPCSRFDASRLPELDACLANFVGRKLQIRNDIAR